jgi:hypothetical protein
MDMTKYAESKSMDLKAKDFVGKNLRAKIEGVEIVHFEATDKQAAQDKPRLKFVGKEKGLVLNFTNTQTLVKAYGSESDSWIGHDISLTVEDYNDKGFGYGWIVKALDVKAPDFDDDIPF